ncbi:vitellogenin-4 isoform X2 [Anabrus simplex]|uniref:vitellogenin-4 isoform X2 n=1 Tax=Anabrus simplex TaxID=316456 RepID=UPI0034DD24BD
MLSAGGILFLLTSFLSVAQGLFIPDQQLVYHYHAVVHAGTSTPTHASSDWELKGKLIIQAYQDHAVVQLTQLTTSLYNGKSTSASNHVFHPTPPEISELLQPFKINYEHNKVKDITVAGNEQVWSINIKRAVANLLQLDESQFNSRAFITHENTLYGECRTEYSISEENGKIIARKFMDINDLTCKGFPRLGWSNVSPLICSPTPQAISTSIGRKYVLVPLENGGLNIESVQSRGGTNVQPFQALGEIQYAFVNQTLQLEKSEDIAEPLKVSPSGRNVGLTFEPPRKDLTQGRAPLTNESTLKLIDLYLGKLSDKVEINPLLVESHELHDEYVSQLLHYLSLLDKPNLEQYYQRLVIGTSYQQETLRNLFMKLLPQVGSDASVLFIRDLVHVTKDNTTAIELLTVFPFYVRQHSEQLLTECETLLSLGDNVHPDVKSAAVLSFSILVHKTCRQPCQPATLDRYIRQYVDLFSGSRNYDEQLLYLEALNNIEIGDVYDYIEPVIRGNVTVFTERPHHIRFLGVWATMTAAYNPTKTLKIYQTYWPILTNRSEHLEMRVAALTMLMLSGPTYGNFFNLLWFMESEPNPHLQNFFYTTLVSLIDTKYPCYKGLGSLASHLIRFAKPPSASNWATGNYILDYADPLYGFGGMAQLFAVANQRTGNPNVLHLLLDSFALGYTVRRLELYLKLEGVGDVLKKLMINLHGAEILKLNDLLALLESLQAPFIASEPVHIEIIAKVEGKVILCQYINANTLHKLVMVTARLKIISQEFHINYQNVKAPLIMEMFQPADIGVPIVMSLDSSVLMSLRGNYTKNPREPSSRNTQIDIRYSLNAGGSVIVYNPIHNLWHVAKRTHSYQNYIPINHQITIVPNQQQIKFSFTKPADMVGGVIAHTQSAVQIRGVGSVQILEQFCSSCQVNYIVNKNNRGMQTHELLNETIKDLGMRFEASMFDCDYMYSSPDYIKLIQGILSKDNKNSRVLPASRYWLGIVHVLDLVTLIPPHGSCGLEIKMASTDHDDIVIEGVLGYKNHEPSSDNPGSKQEISLSLSHKVPDSHTALHEWIIGIIHKVSQDRTKRHLRLRLAHATKGKQDHKLCLDSEVKMPKSHDGVLLPWTPSESATAKANLIWGKTEGSSSSKCPQDGLEISISAQGEIIDEQKALMNLTSSGPRGICLSDTKNIDEWGEEYTPITGACYQASYEQATLRRYTATIKYKNVPKAVSLAISRVGALLELMQPGITSDMKDSTLVISIEVPISQPIVKLAINKQQVYISKAKSWIEPLLINTRFSPTLPIKMKLNLIGSCVVNSARVISFDSVNFNFDATPCYTLIAADCTKAPLFAVLAKKVAGTKLAVKVYVGGNEIEIIPTEQGKLQVSASGQLLDLSGKDYYYPSYHYIYTVRQVEDGQVRITTDVSGIWVQHNGHVLILVAPMWHKGQLCGMCADFNGDGNNDVSYPLSLPC